ncbi:MAG: hypothetical protein ABW250_26870 [Pyrinomonadaceae bacterium]
MTAKIQISNPEAIIRRYQTGESILSLSRELGFSRPAISRWLARQGIELRSASEQEGIKWKQIKKNPEAVERQLKAAWTAAAGRGYHMQPAAKLKRAQTCYRNKSHVHTGEEAVGAAIADEGFAIEYQYPAGFYLIDVAIPDSHIAVEVFASNWKPRHAEALTKRTSYLLDEGWLVLFVFIWRKGFGLLRQRNREDKTFAPAIRLQPWFDPQKVASKVADLSQRIERREKLHGRFGIISGNGCEIPTPRGHLVDLPRVSWL